VEYNRVRVQFREQYETADQEDSVITLIVATGTADREGLVPGPLVRVAVRGVGAGSGDCRFVPRRPNHFARIGDIGFRLTGGIWFS
jgi:hypothetical protein